MWGLGQYTLLEKYRECLGRIMGRHECLCIPSDPSHSGNAEQGDDGQGSPISDRTLLAQPSMVPNSASVVDRPAQEAPRVGSPPLAPFRESLPQLFPTLPNLVDFLNYLFTERKLSVSAIKGYKSALAASLRLIGCWENVWEHVYDSSTEYVSSTPKGQCWDLSLGLRALMEEPFEPMDRASLKNITLKMVFLWL
jgi:hypothetical protein